MHSLPYYPHPHTPGLKALSVSLRAEQANQIPLKMHAVTNSEGAMLNLKEEDDIEANAVITGEKKMIFQ